jgi:hypothetical protein
MAEIAHLRLSLSIWDLVLFGVVTALGTLMAYVPSPRWKAFLLSLPFPFTVANLSLGAPVGPSHALGLMVLLLFTNLVRWLHYGWKLPILVSIALSAVAYVGLGVALNRVLPATPVAFWLVLGLSFGTGLLLLRLLPHREEPPHRSPLPVAMKLLVIAGVVGLLVVLKQLLGGFMAVFPMVGTIAAYEARYSLWTVGRQIPVIMVTLGVMMAVMWLVQRWTAATIGASLLVGWAFFLGVLVPLSIRRWKDSAPAQQGSAAVRQGAPPSAG